MSPVHEKINIRDSSIRLGQFLKLCGRAGSGAEAKHRIQAGEVLVNGTVETRRGRQLRHGDTVEMDGQSFMVIGPEHPLPGETTEK